MNTKAVVSRITMVLLASLLLVLAIGCERVDDGASPATAPDDAEVFIDEFADGVTYQAFAGSKLDAVDGDASMVHGGTQALRITVPTPDNPTGSFAGGAFTTNTPRDLTGYDAITFWAKADMAATLNVAGLGNDNTGTSLYMAETYDLELSTTWTKYIIPIPLPDKLEAEMGLFYFAEGAEDGVGYTFWIDDLKFESLGNLDSPDPDIGTMTVEAEIGEEILVDGATVTYSISGNDRVVSASQHYFTFSSSNPGVVEVAEDGTLTAVGMGTATITAELGSVDASGSITVDVGEGPAMPASAAPSPEQDPGDVISLYSNAYTNVTIDTWSAEWDMAEVADLQVEGNDIKQYTDLVFAGVEFISVPVNASAMTHFSLDLWTPDAVTNDTEFKVKLVDFGADGAFEGGDDSESELTFTPANTAGFASGTWVAFDIPLDSFTGLTGRSSITQLIVSGDLGTIYLDNIYFYAGDVTPVTEPTTPAPTPDEDPGNVVPLYSGAYTNATVDTWSAEWDQADVEDVQIEGDDMKKYSNMTVAGIEFTSETLDASEMTFFHVDIWTPDPTASPAAFKIKLVDFGADGAWSGGDDSEHEITLNSSSDPMLLGSAWNSLDIPLAEFAGLAETGHLAQLIFSGDVNTVYVDNIYFHNEGEVITNPEPEEAAPTPSYPASGVISLFSNAYSNVTVDTWSAEWDEAAVQDVVIAGDDAKKYAGLVYAGVEFTSETIDASSMTHFSMDIWTPDNTDPPAVFKIKLVDFGADGEWSGGDDVEHELTFDASTSPALASGQWVTFDIPLSEFANMTTVEHIAQLIFSGDPNTVYVDNVLFHN